MSELRDLYQQMIIDHGRHPRNTGEIAAADFVKEGFNPLCGDKLTLYIQYENDIVKAVKFKGEGCAISMASASLMTEAIKGLTIVQVKALFAQFHSAVTEEQADFADLGKLAIFKGVREFPARVKCATLAWHTLLAALDHQSGSVSTE